jgi:mRNA export factor
MDTDILDGILELEDEFYKEGYALGVADGARAGYTEGSVFAVENAFEKLLQLGKLYGKALVWNQRLISSATTTTSSTAAIEKSAATEEPPAFDVDICKSMPELHQGSRLAKNIQTLLALVDPATLVLENNEDAVSDIEERLRGAALKAKLIQRALGESDEGTDATNNPLSRQDVQRGGDGSGSIEDISSLHVRH